MPNCEELTIFLKSYCVILDACKSIVQSRGIDLSGCCDYCLSVISDDELELSYYDGSQICGTNVYFDELNTYLN